MPSKFQLTAIALALLVSMPSALIAQQSAPLTRESTGEDRTMAGDRPQPRTPYQQFAERLKLDAKTQVPAVEQILADAGRDAAPVAQQMLQLRQQLVNLALANQSDATKPVIDAYTAAAAKMTGIEASAFAKVYAILKPNQQANAAQAFTIMGGMFQPAAPRGGASRGSGPRGGGGQR
jgi:hypothetical protein